MDLLRHQPQLFFHGMMAVWYRHIAIVLLRRFPIKSNG